MGSGSGAQQAHGLSAAAALVEELDKQVLVVLRDNTHVHGILRSVDQFSNLVLDSAFERIAASDVYADKPLGLYVVRGENLVLLGRLDEQPVLALGNRQRVTVDEAQEALRRDREADASAVSSLRQTLGAFLDEA